MLAKILMTVFIFALIAFVWISGKKLGVAKGDPIFYFGLSSLVSVSMLVILFAIWC